MLELVIAVVVAFVVGLLIGVSSMQDKVRGVEHHLAAVHSQFDEFKDTVYDSTDFQINLIKCGPLAWQGSLTNNQRKRLRRLGSQLLRIKDKDEDHPDSVEEQ